MQNEHVSLGLLSLLTMTVATGCTFGGAGFSGELGQQSFDPGGTVFSYLDAHDDSLVEQPRPKVVVVMTWLTFNPQADLNDRSGSALEDMRHELLQRDALALVFDDQAEVTGGKDFAWSRQGAVEDATSGLHAALHLTPERLDGASTYSDFTAFGARQVVSVHLDKASFLGSSSDGLQGSAVIAIERTNTDPANTQVGRVEGRFSAPLVDERIAEQNLALLGVQSVLGVPIPSVGPAAGATP